MAEKDVTEKTLESYNDVFADIVNVLLFHGKEIVLENDLADALPRSHFKANGKLHEQERDVAKYWKQNELRIAFLGFENQTSSDNDMPLRVIGYDGAAYKSQLLRNPTKTKHSINCQKKVAIPRFPIVTLVLYFGYTEHWDKPLSLYECLSIPTELRPYVNDYKINLFEIAYLSDDLVNMFQSDFRIVADYFVQMRKNNNYKPSPDIIKHVHETLELMSVMTNDYRFESACNELKGENLSMCEFLDRIVEEGKIELLSSLIKDGLLSTSDAAKRVNMTEKEFLACLDQINSRKMLDVH